MTRTSLLPSLALLMVCLRPVSLPRAKVLNGTGSVQRRRTWLGSWHADNDALREQPRELGARFGIARQGIRLVVTNCATGDRFCFRGTQRTRDRGHTKCGRQNDLHGCNGRNWYWRAKPPGNVVIRSFRLDEAVSGSRPTLQEANSLYLDAQCTGSINRLF